VAEIEAGEFDAELTELKHMSLEALKERYKSRQIES